MFCIHAQSYWLDPLIKGNIFWVRYDLSYKYRQMDVIAIENLGKTLLATVFITGERFNKNGELET